MLFEIQVSSQGSIVSTHRVTADGPSEAIASVEKKVNSTGRKFFCYESRELPVTAAVRLFTAYDQILVEGRSVSTSTFLAGLKRGSVNPAGYFIDTLQVTRDEFQWRLEQV